MKNKLLFYHYKPLKKLEHLIQLKNYLNQKIWFTRVDELNDPFEGEFVYKASFPKEIEESNSGYDVYSLSKLPENINDGKYSGAYVFTENKLFYISNGNPQEIAIENFEKVKVYLRGIMGNSEFSRLTNSQMRELIILAYTEIKNYFKSHGVLCLTNDCSNIPMWAHYADNHQGYCVVFEMDFDYIYNLCKENFINRSKFDEYVERIINPHSNGVLQEILSFNQKLDKGASCKIN